ncbi:MAG: hypothetical protein K6D02_02980 [Lachnospiraceae bacterium]|nr:hypothetical protein [Lachnospiraceae bacterium]
MDENIIQRGGTAMGFLDLDDFMGGLFDFDGDGRTSFGEKMLSYKIYDEVTKEEDDKDNNSAGILHESQDLDDTEDSDTIESTKDSSSTTPFDYRKYVIGPLDLFSPNAIYAWRDQYVLDIDHYIPGVGYLDPRDYETEEEFLKAYEETREAALKEQEEKEKYAWREVYKNDDFFTLNPDDFEREEDFREATIKLLEEEKNSK